MAHQHQVVDGDIRFKINPITRVISRVDASKSSLVVGDHNSERFTFEIPKTVEGHDMSLCNVVRVHYLNTSSDNKSVQSLGVYEVDDFAPDSEDENIMRFSWLISRKATKHVGPLAFTIQFACMTGFKVDYSWQSGIFSGITVSNAVNGAEVVIDEYTDILQQWWEQLYASSELPITIMPFQEFVELGENTKYGMLYLLSDDPAVDELEKIPGIEQSIAALNIDVDNLEEEVKTNKENIAKLTSDVEFTTNEKIPGIEQSITTLNTDVDNLEEEVKNNKENITKLTSEAEESNKMFSGIDKNLTTLNTDVYNLKNNVARNTTRFDAVPNVVNGIGSKWQWGDYTKLYVYDTAKINAAITTKVITGLYMLKAEYNDPDAGYMASTTVMLDTLDKESASTSFSIPRADGSISHYRIGCRELDSSGVMEIIPYSVNTVVVTPNDETGVNQWECLYSDDVKNITLYGRRIYTNPLIMMIADTLICTVTPITELSDDGVVHYLRVTGKVKVQSDTGTLGSDFEGFLYLDSASPAELIVMGASIKSNRGVIETNLGDIVITDDISVYGQNATISVIGNEFTLYSENVVVYDHGIYIQSSIVDIDNYGTGTVTPITSRNGDDVQYYLRVTGKVKIDHTNGHVTYGTKDFEGFLYLDSASPVDFGVIGLSIKDNRGTIETTLGDIDITGDISSYGSDIEISLVDEEFTLYFAHTDY